MTVTMALGFITGLYQGSFAGLENQGISFSEIQMDQLILTIVIGLVFLFIIVGGIFIFLRWGFRKLYGNYIQKLKLTLKELTEIDE
jgi:heme/copper-type cytochrome/quinol oxidase subunit 2